MELNDKRDIIIGGSILAVIGLGGYIWYRRTQYEAKDKICKKITSIN